MAEKVDKITSGDIENYAQAHNTTCSGMGIELLMNSIDPFTGKHSSKRYSQLWNKLLAQIGKWKDSTPPE